MEQPIKRDVVKKLLEQGKTATEVAEVMIPGDGYWNESARQRMAAMIAFVASEGEKDNGPELGK